MITDAVLILWLTLSVIGALTTVATVGKERKPLTPQTAAVTVAIHLVAIGLIIFALVS